MGQTFERKWSKQGTFTREQRKTGYQAVERCSETIELDGLPCRILRIDALVAAKKALGRPKDLQTIQQLEVIQRERGQR